MAELIWQLAPYIDKFMNSTREQYYGRAELPNGYGRVGRISRIFVKLNHSIYLSEKNFTLLNRKLMLWIIYFFCWFIFAISVVAVKDEVRCGYIFLIKLQENSNFLFTGLLI
jgi:hypothetical protein